MVVAFCLRVYQVFLFNLFHEPRVKRLRLRRFPDFASVTLLRDGLLRDFPGRADVLIGVEHKIAPCEPGVVFLEMMVDQGEDLGADQAVIPVNNHHDVSLLA